MYESYFLQNWLPRWNQILTQLVEVHPQLSNNRHPVGACSLQEIVQKKDIFNLIAPANKGTEMPHQIKAWTQYARE
jgi:hypothetical protein